MRPKPVGGVVPLPDDLAVLAELLREHDGVAGLAVQHHAGVRRAPSVCGRR
jgi:hypothetical protein